jgi:TM2 domain-containing membrane protein YozV
MAEVGAAEVMQFQQGMTDQQKMIFASQYNSERKDRTTALILSVLLGAFGVDRFYVGDTGIGILKLLTLGVCGILAIIDWFLIMGRADDFNRRKAQEIAAAIRTSS